MRHVLGWWLVALGFCACSGPGGAVQCEQNANCNLTSGGMCLASPGGHQWCAYPDPACPAGYRYSEQSVGDGLAGQCVDEGLPIDARIDAPPDMAIDSGVASGQNANIVIGQNDFTTNIANSGGQSASSLSGPMAVASDGARLWIGEGQNARVLQFNSLPVVNRPLSDAVVGQSSASASSPSTTQTTIRIGDVSAFAAGGKLFVVDGSSSRVLVYNAIPTASGAAASVVVGQSTFTTSATGKSASGMNGPTDVWSDGTRLVVVDNANSRVLIWTSLPTANGQAANVVLGRAAFGLGLGDAVADPPTNATMKFPTGVWSNGTRLYVADAGNHRVMVWNTFPTANGAPCDFVLGQTAFDKNAPNAGGATANALGLQNPYKAVEANGSLYISDSVNHRVVIHTPIPTMNGEQADAVLGQDNLDSSSVPNTPTANRMSSPRWIAAVGDELFVPDYAWHRVLGFDLTP